MKLTIFNTPVITPIISALVPLVLGLLGWTTEGELPQKKKFVMIAAPHTSNWDMVMMLVLCFYYRLEISWLGKDTLFRFPFGTFMRWTGGIAVDRSKANNLVEESIRLFNEREKFVLTVPPEGTRGKVRYWKTGFYRMADGAGVPIVLGFIDWGRKVGGVGGPVTTTGDIDADMEVIKEFYSHVTPKIPDLRSDIDVDAGKGKKHE